MSKSFLLLFFKKEKSLFLERKKQRTFAYLVSILCTQPAVAQVRGVTLIPPSHDFGYFLGDTLSVEAVIGLAPGTQLDSHSLPILGQIGPGIDIRQVTMYQADDTSGNNLHIRIQYQNFVAPEEAMQVRIPGYTLEFHNGATPYTAQIPYWSFYTSPFRHERQPTVDPSVLRPDHSVAAVPAASFQRGFFISLFIALFALAALARNRGWAPRIALHSQPFASAAAQIARLARRDATTTYHIDARLALHRAFDTTSGRRVLAEDIPIFLQAHPNFTPLRADIEQFFSASRALFFAPNSNPTAPIAPPQTLLRFARKLRRAERAG